jgi:phenylalanine-4-hydroxylase
MVEQACEFRPFDLLSVLRTPYRIDIVQPIYYVIDSFADLEAVVGQDIGAMIVKAKSLGDFAPTFEAKAS